MLGSPSGVSLFCRADDLVRRLVLRVRRDHTPHGSIRLGIRHPFRAVSAGRARARSAGDGPRVRPPEVLRRPARGPPRSHATSPTPTTKHSTSRAGSPRRARSSAPCVPDSALPRRPAALPGLREHRRRGPRKESARAYVQGITSLVSLRSSAPSSAWPRPSRSWESTPEWAALTEPRARPARLDPILATAWRSGGRTAGRSDRARLRPCRLRPRPAAVSAGNRGVFSALGARPRGRAEPGSPRGSGRSRPAGPARRPTSR
jgi:hypothetical protein